MKTKIKIILMLFIGLIFASFSVSIAGVDKNASINNSAQSQNAQNATLANCARSTSNIVLELNNVRTTLHNGGDKWWSVFSPSTSRYEIPKEDNPQIPKKHSIFAGSIWLGGIAESNQDLHVIASTYRQASYSLWPGPIDEISNSTTTNSCRVWNQHFKVNKSVIQQFIIDYDSGLIKTINDIPHEILNWPGKNNPHLNTQLTYLDQDLAPFVDNRNSLDGYYDPMSGDYPKIEGDEAIWWVMNDIGNVKEFGGILQSNPPLGMEIQEMAYAFATNDPLNDMTFYKQKMIHRGNKSMSQTFAGIWVDGDLGFSQDDYVQCDVTRSLGIVYNADNFDEGLRGYGTSPPAVGVDLFQGPRADLDTIGDGIDNDNDGLVDESDNGYQVYEGDGLDNDLDGVIDELDENFRMTTFLMYNNNMNPRNGNPGSAQDFYNYLMGYWRDGTRITHDLQGGTDQSYSVTNYMFPGNSLIAQNVLLGISDVPDDLNTPWFPNFPPSDIRMLLSTGGFTLEPGEVNEYIYGVPWAKSEFGHLESVEKLKCVDDLAQQLFDDNFALLNGPDAPNLSFIEKNKEIVITINPQDFILENQGQLLQQNTESYTEYDASCNSELKFEGYKVYQLANNNVKPEEYDDPNKARMIYQTDISNGIGDINTYSFTYQNNMCFNLPQIAVNGADSGLTKVISIKTDAFRGNGTLINYQTYYFSVIAYGYNSIADSLNQLPRSTAGVFQNYIESRRNIKSYAASAQVINSPISSGSDFQMKAISGIGNGGRFLNLKDYVIDSIINGKNVNLHYTSENSPLDISIYNPFIPFAFDSMEVFLTSRLTYDKNSTNTIFLPGDTIESIANYNLNLDTIRLNKSIPQINGKAVVIGERADLETTDSKTLEVRLLNGTNGGTFIREILRYRKDGPWLTFQEDAHLESDFIISGNARSLATCIDFKSHDFWNLEYGGQTYRGDHPISKGIEELISPLGLRIAIKNANPPGYNSWESGNYRNGYIDQKIEFLSQSNTSLSAVDLIKMGVIENYNSLDNIIYDYQGVYISDLIGPFYPYSSLRPIGLPIFPGWTINVPPADLEFDKLTNVDLVITNDQSLWTRCPVIQINRPSISNAPPIISYSQKSMLQSVDKNGNPDPTFNDAFTGGSSKGYGWFPGYAIDVDRGIRLNLAFTENELYDSIAGNDLIYNPYIRSDTPHHFIAITNLEYDMDQAGGNFQFILDSLFEDQRTVRSDKYGQFYNEIFTWTGALDYTGPMVTGSYTFPEMKIKMRVNKPYQQTVNGESPRWIFGSSLNNRQAQRSSELEQVTLVPNPYLFQSAYGTNGDHELKITQLPPKCTINVYNSSGSLIKTFRRDYDMNAFNSESGFQEWNLRNEFGTEISSGMYLVHISEPEGNETVKKLFIVKGAVE